MSERRKEVRAEFYALEKANTSLFQYRYEDIGGKRQTIHDRDLNELRKKKIRKQDKVYQSMEMLEKRCNYLEDVLSSFLAVFRKHDEKPKTPVTPFVHKMSMV